MDRKKKRKSKAAKSMKDLPVKTLNAKTAKAVKGGDGPKEEIVFVYGHLK